jgi:hypothetical protein
VEECVLDLPSITRTVVRVCEEKLDRSFHCFNDNETELMLLRNAVAAQRKRRNQRKCKAGKATCTTNKKIFADDYDDAYGIEVEWEEEEDEDGGSGGGVVNTRYDEYKVTHLDRYELIAALTEEEQIGLFKCKVAMEWLESRLEASKQNHDKVNRHSRSPLYPALCLYAM